MKDFKYKHVVLENGDVISISSFAGKTVRGVAHCHPEDKFNLDKGIAIADAKCALKIANLREKRAFKCMCDAREEAEKAQDKMEKEYRYFADAIAEQTRAQEKLDRLLISTRH